MPLPKRRHSRTRRDKRRTHDSLTGPNVVNCPQCGDPKLSHHVCQNCGTYKGRSVIEEKE
ncbi:MAG: 50S ribosomal protein L32 [Thermodesulfobacteriota bacterium]